MTPKDQATIIVENYGLLDHPHAEGLIYTIERAITAAITEDRASRECCKAEREACAEIASAMVETFKAELKQRLDEGNMSQVVADFSAATGTAELIARQIRARSTASPEEETK